MKYPLLATLLAVWAAAARGDFAAPQGFVGISGDQFIYGGQIYKLKGTNYYPRDHMWASMWTDWDWSEIQTEATMIKNLGMNCVRILVPYSYGGWGGPNVPESRLIKLENIVNLLGEKGIRSCITLFDWETSYPAAGTAKETDHISHLSAIVSRLKNNKYVFMWDVKNEPDHPSILNGRDDWDDPGVPAGVKSQIISWLSRMCAAVRARDSNHPVTAGIRWYNNVADVISFEDIAVFHNYWRTTISTVQIPTVKAAMGGSQKPILVQEFGWPTNPTPCYRDGSWIYDYNETEQLNMNRDTLNAFITHNTAGGLQWMTFDSAPYSSDPYHTYGDYFGLWRFDYTLKQGSVYYRDNFPVSQFPSEPDTSPPGLTQSFTAIPYDGAVRLTWTNTESYDFKGTMIRYKTTGYPTSRTDGVQLCKRAASPGSSDSYTHTGLTNGVRYYYCAFSYDGVPNYSAGVQASAVPQPAPPGVSCGAAKLLPNNTTISLNGKLCTGVFADESCVYVEEPDRSAGIRVAIANPDVAAGDVVNVMGTVTSRKPDGVNVSERQVTATALYTASPTRTFCSPLAMNCRALGGGPIPPNVPGVKDGFGLNNIGLLVQVTGRVTAAITSYIWLDDGSAIPDIEGRSGVMVKTCSGAPQLSVGDTATVTGVVQGSIPLGWTTNRRFIRTRDASDIVKLD